MNYLSKKSTQAIALFLTLLISTVVFASNPLSGLVITEVFLDSTMSGNSWIEIYNPTNNSLVLEKLRLSNIRTTNVLPDLKDEIKVNAKEIIILCADMEIFEKLYGKLQNRIIEVKALTMLSNGGFISLATKNNHETGGDIIRYGVREMSLKAHSRAGNYIIQFSENKSFSRKIVESVIGESISEFQKSNPTPGYLN